MSDMNYYNQNPNNYGGFNQGQPEKKGCGVAAVVCGIFAWLFSVIPCVGPILAIIAIITGVIQVKRGYKKGMGIFGIVAGILAAIIGIVFSILEVVFLPTIISDLTAEDDYYIGDECYYDELSGCAWLYDDGSVLYLIEDDSAYTGQFVWYADDADHTDNYYYGYYDLYQADDAVNYLGGEIPFNEDLYETEDLYHVVLYLTECSVNGAVYGEDEIEEYLSEDVRYLTIALDTDDWYMGQCYEEARDQYNTMEVLWYFTDEMDLPTVYSDTTGSSETTTETSGEGSISADGRSTGHVIEGRVGEGLTNSFFTCNLLSATEYDSYMIDGEDMVPNDGYTMIVCDLAITNIMSGDIPMFITDFEVEVELEDGTTFSDYGYGASDVGDYSFMEEQYSIAPGETITTKVLFVVPAADEYTFVYLEYWDDDFVGDKYIVNFVPTKE